MNEMDRLEMLRDRDFEIKCEEEVLRKIKEFDERDESKDYMSNERMFYLIVIDVCLEKGWLISL